MDQVAQNLCAPRLVAAGAVIPLHSIDDLGVAPAGNHRISNPPELVSVYRKVRVGPAGIDMTIETRLLSDGSLRAELVINNKTTIPRLYNCFFFPPAGSFAQQQVTVPAGKEVRRGINFRDGAKMIGKRFRVRAVEQKSKRVMNYEVTVTR